MTIKAILDTNVLISGIFWKGAPFQILKAWQGRRFCLAISLPILDESRRVLEEMTRKRPSAVLGSMLALIELHSEMVEPIHFAKTVCSISVAARGVPFGVGVEPCEEHTFPRQAAY